MDTSGNCGQDGPPRCDHILPARSGFQCEDSCEAVAGDQCIGKAIGCSGSNGLLQIYRGGQRVDNEPAFHINPLDLVTENIGEDNYEGKEIHLQDSSSKSPELENSN